MAKLTQTKEFKKLIAIGSERGYLTFQEVNRLLPEGAFDQDKLEKMFEFLKNKHQIEVIEDPNGAKNGESDPDRAALRKPSAQPDKALTDAYGKTNDPVRMYLRKMGSVSLPQEAFQAILKKD